MEIAWLCPLGEGCSGWLTKLIAPQHSDCCQAGEENGTQEGFKTDRRNNGFERAYSVRSSASVEFLMPMSLATRARPATASLKMDANCGDNRPWTMSASFSLMFAATLCRQREQQTTFWHPAHRDQTHLTEALTTRPRQRAARSAHYSAVPRPGLHM